MSKPGQVIFGCPNQYAQPMWLGFFVFRHSKIYSLRLPWLQRSGLQRMQGAEIIAPRAADHLETMYRSAMECSFSAPVPPVSRSKAKHRLDCSNRETRDVASWRHDAAF
jgi:hypothetical protein